MKKILIKYIAQKKILATLCFYFLFSSILNVITGIDICIPCLLKLLFGFKCPGCGLTSAFISILEFNFKKAIESNWLIFIILPYGLYLLINDFIKYKNKFNQ